MPNASKKLVICLDNSGYEVSLERRKIYVAIQDARAERLGQIRIIDESGEDYLYPEKNFISADLPQLTDVGPGVQEIRLAHSKQAYRVIYVATLGDCIYVLHAFQKKAKTGIATPKEELDLASKRYKELVRSLRRS